MRPTGDHATDIQNLHTAMTAMHEYLTKFHIAAVTESKLLDPAHQATPAEIVPTNLPDPADSSIATATAVANAAYKKAFGL